MSLRSSTYAAPTKGIRGRFLSDAETQLRATELDVRTSSKLSTAEYRSVILRVPSNTKDRDRLRRFSLERSYGRKPLDPIMAKAIPSARFTGFVLPQPEWLAAAADTAHGRQLYDRQLSSFSDALDNLTHPLIRERWVFMKSLASAVAQERMRDAPY